MIIRILILVVVWLAVWLAIIAAHFWVCRKRVWLEYDFDMQELEFARIPTRQTLIDEQYSKGGPLIVLPFTNILILLVTWITYIERKCEYNEKYRASELWNNKPLKR